MRGGFLYGSAQLLIQKVMKENKSYEKTHTEYLKENFEILSNSMSKPYEIKNQAKEIFITMFMKDFSIIFENEREKFNKLHNTNIVKNFIKEMKDGGNSVANNKEAFDGARTVKKWFYVKKIPKAKKYNLYGDYVHNEIIFSIFLNTDSFFNSDEINVEEKEIISFFYKKSLDEKFKKSSEIEEYLPVNKDHLVILSQNILKDLNKENIIDCNLFENIKNQRGINQSYVSYLNENKKEIFSINDKKENWFNQDEVLKIAIYKDICSLINNKVLDVDLIKGSKDKSIRINFNPNNFLLRDYSHKTLYISSATNFNDIIYIMSSDNGLLSIYKSYATDEIKNIVEYIEKYYESILSENIKDNEIFKNYYKHNFIEKIMQQLNILNTESVNFIYPENIDKKAIINEKFRVKIENKEGDVVYEQLIKRKDLEKDIIKYAILIEKSLIEKESEIGNISKNIKKRL